MFEIIWLLVIGLLAAISDHRKFSHSLLALGLFSIPLLFINNIIAFSFIIAFISHILLDVMNKKGVYIFYPKNKGYCFKWFYADKTANIVFLVVGIISLLVEVGMLCV